MYNRNRGYVGNSRSVRSEEAIMNNEVPMNMINMDKLGQVANEIEIPEVMEKVKLLTLAKFKTWISPSSWHHTGSYFNETNHYNLESNLLELNELSKHDIIELNLSTSTELHSKLNDISEEFDELQEIVSEFGEKKLSKKVGEAKENILELINEVAIDYSNRHVDFEYIDKLCDNVMMSFEKAWITHGLEDDQEPRSVEEAIALTVTVMEQLNEGLNTYFK